MKRTLVIATALAAGLATSTVIAQAPAAAPAAPAAAPAPQAIPAKIAIIAFEQTVGTTNEGQKLVASLRKKYETKENDLRSRNTELESLKAKLQGLAASAPDDERGNLIKQIDTKDKSLQRDAEDLQNAEQADFQEGFNKLAQKVGNTAVKYVQEHGYTVLLNQGGQGANLVLWADQTTDVSQAVVNEYNKVSGVAAPPPSAPAPARRTTPPAAPKPAGPKQ